MHVMVLALLWFLVWFTLSSAISILSPLSLKGEHFASETFFISLAGVVLINFATIELHKNVRKPHAHKTVSKTLSIALWMVLVSLSVFAIFVLGLASRVNY